MDRSSVIFGNKLPQKEIRKAEKGKQSYIKKFGDDSGTKFFLEPEKNEILGKYFNAENLKLLQMQQFEFGSKSVIIGNIRMGFGHYRISMAMASAARALGYKPYWLDLHSFAEATCGKVIRHQNDLYSLGSRLSQKSFLFNKYWENLNSEGFRKLSYNAADQKKAELMAPICAALPKDIPFVATHVWPAQAAVHAGLTNVVNAIPDNWPMALHLAEGAIHTVQTPSAALGYKALRGMAKRPLKPMPDKTVCCTGHYIDHELVSNIEADCAARADRMARGAARRYLMTVGGAGAGTDLFISMIRHLLPEINSGKAVLFINYGDHEDVYKHISAQIPELSSITTEHFDDFGETADFAQKAYSGDVSGVHAFGSKDTFAAVYSTNLLMRCSDILVTKPSELAFYPIPKLMIKRVGGHEAWGAIRSAEVGDGTYECDTAAEINAMLDLFQNDDEALSAMLANILTAKTAGIYNGAYEVIKLATGERTL